MTIPAAIEYDLAQRIAVHLTAVQIGDEIGHRDVEQAGGGEREDERPDGGDQVDGAERGQGAENAGSARDDIQDQRVAPAVSGGQENRHVADLLRDLVRRDGDGRVDAERDRGQDRGADDRAVDEIVKGVTDDHQRRRGTVHLALVGVAMVNQHQLLENEKHEDAGQQGAEHGARRDGLQRFREQREKRDPEQRSDGVADETRHQSAPDVVGEQQQRRCDEQTAEAAEETQSEDRHENRHATFYPAHA